MRQPESAGDANEARGMLASAVQKNPGSAAALRSYAEFLEQYGQPEARAVYAQLLAQLRRAGGAAEAAEIAHRLVILDLLAGDGEALARDRESYRAITGKALPSLERAARSVAYRPHTRTDAIVRANGRHCARGGARDVLPALARNVVTNGYQASRSNETLEQTST